MLNSIMSSVCSTSGRSINRFERVARKSVRLPSVVASSLPPSQNDPKICRRQILPIAIGLASSLVVRPALAEDAAVVAAAPAPATATQPFYDDDYTLEAPGDWIYVEAPIPKTERGPAPERSPVRARFDTADGNGVLSVIVRNAQMLKQTLLQVGDISAYGTPQEAVAVLVPRGSKVLSIDSETEVRPPKVTPLGDVEIPPRTYYRYEIIAPNGQHVIMTAAAQKGRVYVCGVSTTEESWPRYADAARAAAASFRLK